MTFTTAKLQEIKSKLQYELKVARLYQASRVPSIKREISRVEKMIAKKLAE